jgi:aminopeptidase YwaD
MGESHTKGLGYLADSPADAAALSAAYREARVAVQHQAQVEKAVVRSAGVLYTDVEAGKKKTAVFDPLIDKRAAALLDEVAAAYRLHAAQRNITLPAVVGEPALSAEEKEAASLVVELATSPAAGAAGGAGGRGAGGGAAAGAGGGGRGRGFGGPGLPTEFSAEFSALLPKHMTVLEIRDFLSGEFTPLPLKDVMAVVKAREAAGSIRLVPKPAPLAAVAGKKK